MPRSWPRSRADPAPTRPGWPRPPASAVAFTGSSRPASRGSGRWRAWTPCSAAGHEAGRRQGAAQGQTAGWFLDPETQDSRRGGTVGQGSRRLDRRPAGGDEAAARAGSAARLPDATQDRTGAALHPQDSRQTGWYGEESSSSTARAPSPPWSAIRRCSICRSAVAAARTCGLSARTGGRPRQRGGYRIALSHTARRTDRVPGGRDAGALPRRSSFPNGCSRCRKSWARTA